MRAPLLLLLALLTSWVRPARGVPLRIETGEHRGPITALARSALGQVLLSAGADRALRVWDPLGLRPPQVLHLPGPALQPLTAAALSPDGALVIAGGPGDEALGLRGFLGGGELRFLDRFSGAQVRALPLESPPLALAVSADGSLLAVALSSGAVRLLSLPGGEALGRDEGFAGPVRGLAFAAAGILFASADDGEVRRYQSGAEGLLRTARARSPGGRLPHGLALSSDGELLAVGHRDRAVVALLEAETLRPLRLLAAPDLAADLRHVAFSLSAGGATQVSAGGRGLTERAALLRFEARGGPAKPLVLPVSGSVLTALLPLPDRGLALATEAPALAVLRPFSPPTLLRDGPRPAPPRARALRAALPPSLLQALDALDAPGGAAAAAPLPLPQLATALALADAETLLALAPRPPQVASARRFLVAAVGRALVRVDRGPEGSTEAAGARFRVELPAPALALALTPDERLIAAALADGTLRWYQSSDGVERLAAYSDPASERYLVFTPQGAFDSTFTDEPLGWLHEPAAQPPRFYPGAWLHPALLRPGLLQRALERDPPREEPLPAPRTLVPPEVRVLAPAPASELPNPLAHLSVAVRRAGDAPLLGLQVFIDGRPVPGEHGPPDLDALTRDGIERSIAVPVVLPAKGGQVVIRVRTAHAYADSAPLPLRVLGKAERHDLYVLAVGISAYRDPSLHLPYAAKDARDLAAALRRHGRGVHREVFTRVLVDEQATLDELREALEWLQRSPTVDDTSVVLLAGHGTIDRQRRSGAAAGAPRAGRFQFLPYESDGDSALLTGGEIERALTQVPGRMLFMLDACHAGAVLGRRVDDMELTRFINGLAGTASGVVVFAAATEQQRAWESQRWTNGAFTRAVLDGLEGRALPGRGRQITVNMLDAYVSQRVRELTQGRQTPMTAKPRMVPDFPLTQARMDPQVVRRLLYGLGGAALILTTGTVLGLTLRGDPGALGSRDVHNQPQP